MSLLAKRQYRVLREIARAMFDDGCGVAEERLDFMERELRALFASVGAATRFLLRMSLAVLQFAPLFVVGLPRRFTALSPATRVRFLQRFERGTLAILFVAVRIYVSLAYFEHPQGSIDAGIEAPPPLAGEEVDGAIGSQSMLKEAVP